MRIVFIKKKFSSYGGAENYLNNMLSVLSEKGHELHLISTEWPENSSVKVHEINLKSKKTFLSLIEFNRKVKNMINRLNPDCTVSFERITTQDIYRAGDGCHREWLKIRENFDGKIKKISFLINPLHICLLNIEKEIVKNTPLIIANSFMVKEQIISHYCVASEKIIVMYNGVDLNRFSPKNKKLWRDMIRTMYKIEPHMNIILFVGSDFKRKGLWRIIRSLKNIKQDAIVMIVGKGDERYYRNLAKRCGVEKKVLFVGPRKDIEKFYAASDLFVLPTLYDPFSNATLEAMATGLPVITTKNNGASEIIKDAKDGYILYDLFDTEELSEKINMALDRLEDMGWCSRKKAEKYDITTVTDRFLEIVENFNCR